MGLGGISIWQLLIILLIVVLIFGTRRLRNMGGDLGGALKNFRSAMKEGEEAGSDKDETGPEKQSRVIDQDSESSEPAQQTPEEQKNR